MEIEGRGVNIGGNEPVPFESLPKTVLQAIYNVVTGKTERLSKDLNGNVIISSDDIDRLYAMILDQLGIHERETEPTVTVVVNQENDRSFTYSSWERFKNLRLNDHEITSEITLKLEFVLRLPDTPQPQRCVVNINIDSSLPVIRHNSGDMYFRRDIGLFLFMSKDWLTVKLSIDFVDFLVARAFVGVVEEWFRTLKKTPNKRFNSLLLDNIEVLGIIMSQFGRIGMAVFLGAYIWFVEWKVPSLAHLTLAIAIGLLIWALFVVSDRIVRGRIIRRLAVNRVPSIILLTKGDNEAYEVITGKLNSPIRTFVMYTFMMVSTIILNLASSYLYSYTVGSSTN